MCPLLGRQKDITTKAKVQFPGKKQQRQIGIESDFFLIELEAL